MAGNQVTYEYAPDCTPAPSVVGLLCNAKLSAGFGDTGSLPEINPSFSEFSDDLL